ncbi:MAG: hypothetical protein H0V00_17805 [Chloroflexia bacterium]|nr:hypothetical protein [Chloroflexia bacterium]
MFHRLGNAAIDAARFDRIARTLAVSPSRRGLLRVAVGSLLGLLGWDHANAKKKGKGK